MQLRLLGSGSENGSLDSNARNSGSIILVTIQPRGSPSSSLPAILLHGPLFYLNMYAQFLRDTGNPELWRTSPRTRLELGSPGHVQKLLGTRANGTTHGSVELVGRQGQQTGGP